MKTRRIVIVLTVCLAGASCALFKRRPAPYPSGLIFPVAEEPSVSFQGKPVTPVRERRGFFFFSTEEGFIWCVDGAKQQAFWKTQTENDLSAAPSLGQENIYVSDKRGILYCLNSQGQFLWKKSLGQGLLTPVVEDKDRIFFGTEEGRLWSLDLGGEDPRRFEAGSPIRSGPLRIGPDIVFGADNGKIYFVDRSLRGGANQVFQASGRILSPLASDGKLLFFNTEKGDFYGLTIARRKPRWRIRMAGRVLTEPVINGGRLYFLGTNSALYCLKAGSGDILWWQNIPSRTSFGLTVIGDKVVAATLSSDLLAFDAKTGQKAGEFKTGTDLRANLLWMAPFLVSFRYDFKTDSGKLVYLKKEVSVRLNPTKESPRPAGEEIALSASTAGFFKPRYEFFIKDGDKRQVMQKESEKNDWTWYAEQEGNYILGVKVRDEKMTAEAEIPFVIEKREEKKPAPSTEKETKK